MTVTVTATQLASGTPPFAQVVVQGMTNGDTFMVEGTVGVHSWLVQGGMGTSDGTQLILADTRVPWGGAVTYRATVSGVVTEAPPLTIDYDGDVYCVLQSLDGSLVVPVDVATVTDPQTMQVRRALYTIAGRRSRVVRHDVAGLPVRQLAVETDGEATQALLTLLGTGEPIVRRQAVGLRDIAPVQVLTVGDSITNALVGAVGTLRQWVFATEEIDVPEPGTVLALSDWADFDAVYAGASWADFDAEWAGKSWDELDRVDWIARLP